MSAALKYQTVLTTRPTQQANALCQAIENLGGRCLNLPCIEIVSDAAHPDVASLMHTIDSFHCLIFVSANAVHSLLNSYPEAANGKTVIAIGPGTGNALADHAVTVDFIPEHYSSEGLLKLPELNQVSGQHLLIACGHQSRTLLANTLRERGAKVAVCCCYHRKLPNIDTDIALPTQQRQHIDCIIACSAESLHNLQQLLSNDLAWLYSTPLIVISDKMAEQAKQSGWNTPIHIAENASESAIISTLSS